VNLQEKEFEELILKSGETGDILTDDQFLEIVKRGGTDSVKKVNERIRLYDKDRN
jgi:hypothetical protein